MLTAGCTAHRASRGPLLPAGPAAGGPAAPADSGCPRALSLDRVAVTEEATCLLRAYVKLDTTNPPGHEQVTARFLQAYLSREGIATRVFEAQPGRTNLMARLPAARPAEPKKPALMWVHHMDVVPASADEWQYPPLSATVAEGHVWGRGALDNKGPGIATLVAFALVKRLALPLERDLVLLAVADEEAGSAQGARFLMAEHADAFADVAYVLNEGGAVLDLGEAAPVYRVELAQKAPLWLRVRAEGPSGHGSSPRPESASHVLVRGLSRLLAHPFPVKVVPAVAEHFAAMAESAPEADRARYRDIATALTEPAFAAEFLADPHHAALVQNTVSVTMLSASDKENVLAPEATAVIDMRLLPGEDPEAVRAQLLGIMAEPSITLSTLLSWQAHAERRDTPLFAAIEALARERHPGSPVIATVIAGFTDCNAFRAAGKICYGFMPLLLSPSLFSGVHGKDERIPLAALGAGVLDLVTLAQRIDD